MYVLGNIKVKNAIIGKQAKNSKLYQEFLKICKNKKVNIIQAKSGDTLEIENNKVILKFLHPTDNLITNNPLNNNSLVFKLIYKNFSILYTGDIEEEAENLILKNNIDVKADIIKAAHHRL